METPVSPNADVVEACGGYFAAVSRLMELERGLWRIAFPEPKPGIETKPGRSPHRYVELPRLNALLSPEGQATLPLFLERLSQMGLYSTSTNREGRIDLSAFRPFGLALKLFQSFRPDHELWYAVMRDIRRKYDSFESRQTVRLFELMADTANRFCETQKRGELSEDIAGEQQIKIRYHEDFIRSLCEVLITDHVASDDARNGAFLFAECCWAVGYIQAQIEQGCVVINTANFDADYLISRLFGMPTGIPGFDQLFGGGGLLLAEAPTTGQLSKASGRLILVRGRYGTGKSLLSLQLAVEVARKGGMAWVIPTEQETEECKRTIESLAGLPPGQLVEVANNVAEALAYKVPRGETGAVVILREAKQPYEDFLNSFSDRAKDMEKYPLRLIVVDPVNSVFTEEGRPSHIRAQTARILEHVKATGTNVLLTAEEGTGPAGGLLFADYIADTVIHLSVHFDHHHAQRYFEIRKSRLQREQRGEHPFSIQAGRGICIYPSATSMADKIASCRMSISKTRVMFGLDSLDDKLGPNGIMEGDVIVFQGEPGSFKTPLAALFLSCREGSKGSSQSLVIAAADTELYIRGQLQKVFEQTPNKPNTHAPNTGKPKTERRALDDILYCSLPTGDVYPGMILQKVDEFFEKSRQNGKPIDRVVVDNVSRWEISCPFVRDDPIFADTLVNYLRCKRVTSLFVCDKATKSSTSRIQEQIVDCADCLIHFEPFEFRGVRRVQLRIIKTRGMDHRREAFELKRERDEFQVKESSSLLRVGPGGEVRWVPIRLFLHAETKAQWDYNDTIRTAVKAVLSPDTEIKSQDRLYLGKAMSLSPSSAVDELQLLQLDEFQLKDMWEPSREQPLYRFPRHAWNDEQWGSWGGGGPDFVPRLLKLARCSDKDPQEFWAVPFYANISLLAYRQDAFPNLEVLTSWEKLEKACIEWDETHTGQKEDGLFFEFPKGNRENFNCLFLEILLSLNGTAQKESAKETSLVGFLKESPENLVTAGRIYWRLCRKAWQLAEAQRIKQAQDQNQLQKEEKEPKFEPLLVEHSSLIWRHWYRTLNQMLSEMDVKERWGINVAPLPGEHTIAGEWFLGIPSYSAAPEVGLRLIKLVTSREAEMNRLQLGVGLPTRKTFYQGAGAAKREDISPYFRMSIEKAGNLLDHAFQRSQFAMYSKLSGILAHNLKRVLSIPDERAPNIESDIEQIMVEMIQELEFAGREQQP